MNFQLLGNLVVPIIAVIFAMVIGAIFMVSIGANPFEAYWVLVKSSFGGTRNIFETLVNATPLIFTGLSVAFAFRCGLFNIGGEGQFLVAYITAAWVGAFFNMPMWIHIPLTLLAAMLAGAIWGGIPGLLKAKLGVHEVISTIMFNYIGLYLVNLLIRTVLMAPGTLPATPKIAKTAQFARFIRGSRLNWSIFVAALAALIIYWILWKTTIGYEVRAVGLNPFAAEYGGISVARNIILAMAISGALSGLAGASQVMGLELRALQPFGFIGHGFTGIAVALLGKNHPVGIILGALLFGTLQRGANMMQSIAGVPKEVIHIIQAIIIFFVASDYAVRKIYRKIKAKQAKREVNE
ncbi:hypothetical protein BBF96_02915 [Anoxybacter fermentans]|uniref:Sugar ABC transporter permease n=1 Tax=Anoxybacter fermentans TaxID=1323375 RepID=A0A3Q9HSI6_9FIRM|nr:hypothetical protein BBF96_02915 [Anoxybacter fermentans]